MKPLYDAIVAGKLEPAVEVTKDAIAAGVLPQDIINGYMITAMGEVGQRFQDGKAFVPQLLMGGACNERSFGTFETFTGGECICYYRENCDRYCKRRFA